jgi:hypothetical protein
MPALHLVGGDSEPFSRHTSLRVGGQEAIVASTRSFVRTSGQAGRGQPFPNGVPDCAFARPLGYRA